jgi:hypothetical protein
MFDASAKAVSRPGCRSRHSPYDLSATATPRVASFLFDYGLSPQDFMSQHNSASKRHNHSQSVDPTAKAAALLSGPKLPGPVHFTDDVLIPPSKPYLNRRPTADTPDWRQLTADAANSGTNGTTV